MADDSGNLTVTPEVTMSSGVNLRMYSGGKASSGNGEEKILPHYLRASTGSCHDVCKYGGEHSFGLKERRSLPKGIRRTSLGQSSVVSLDAAKKSAVKLRASLDSKLRISDTSDTNKQNFLSKSTESQKQVVYGVPVKKTSVVKRRASLDLRPQISDASDINKQDLLSKSAESQQAVYEVIAEKTSMMKSRASLDSKPQIFVSPETKKLDFPSESLDNQNQVVNEVRVKKTSGVKHRASLDLKPRNAIKQEMPTKTPDVHKQTARQVPVKKSSVVKLRATMDSMPQISGTSDANNLDMPTKSPNSQKHVENEVPVIKKKTSWVKVKSSVHPKPHTSDHSKMIGRKISPTSKKVESLPKPTSFRAKEMKLSAKSDTSSRPKSLTMKTKSSTNSLEGSSGRRNGELKMQKSAASNELKSGKGPSKVATKKLQTPSRVSLSPRPSLNRASSLNSRKHRSLKIASHLKNLSKTRKDEPKQQSSNEVEEKTLYVIKMESENKTSESDQNASKDVDSSCSPGSLSSRKSLSSSTSQPSSQEYQEESEHTTSEEEEDSFSGNHEMELDDVETFEVEEKGKPGKDEVIPSEDRDSQVLKLKFRRGKVIETQSEKNSPRRLKFRPGKVLWENAIVRAESPRKSFKRRNEAGAAVDSSPGPEKVVLRHQDVQGKKDGQGLFNNVIEETASKLVETRKSKVKALVGAFETVISLQEKKPAANTGSQS
ncbi:hypothetical protein L6164_006755 [Bauhinia variegata]|uniref:Uncharacterized protein n=1 Tax=Bauhinia variegata TaxID=167791 RepID=A0ACB9PVE6_BAUVA|nr:hypothetical protein L6164_006755 [Bauhinia variegata]